MHRGRSASEIASKAKKPDESGKTFLFLQGHPSVFWGQLADELVLRGNRVVKVNFCLADVVFWGRRSGKTYRLSFQHWAQWLENLMVSENITDVIYYADRLPYHIEAAKIASKLDINAWVIEFGYLRPDWLTLEPIGMGRFSKFPKSPKAVSKIARTQALPDMSVLYSHPFWQEAFFEVSFNLLLAAGRPFYPRYVSDKIYWPIVEYISWLFKLFSNRRNSRKAAIVEKWTERADAEFNLVALQLQADYQIRASSDYSTLEEFIHEVMQSFVDFAPPERHLVFKIHPLDNGLERWSKRIAKLAEKFGIVGRVHVVNSGDLANLLTNSQGVLLVNSTVGIHAFGLGVPVCVLGSAIFDLEGLTHKSGLNSFWKLPQPVDEIFLAEFLRALSTIQIKGSFFNAKGRAVAIKGICNKLTVDDNRNK